MKIPLGSRRMRELAVLLSSILSVPKERASEATERRCDNSRLLAARHTVRFGAGVVIVAFIWAAISRVDVVVSAEGRVRPAEQVKIINHLRGGRVAKLNVAAGDHVTEHQELLQLDPVLLIEELNKQKPQAVALEAELARLVAEKDDTGAPSFSDEVKRHPNIAMNQMALFAERMAAFHEQEHTLRGAIEERKSSIEQHKARAYSAAIWVRTARQSG